MGFDELQVCRRCLHDGADGVSAHVQIYLDGKLTHDYHGVLEASATETGHEVENGEMVPLKAVITLRLSNCPFGHDTGVGEYCV